MKRVWSLDCQITFDKLKRAIASEPVQKILKFDKPFKIETNVSDRTNGGVLVQEDLSVTFESWKLNKTKVAFYCLREGNVCFSQFRRAY